MLSDSIRSWAELETYLQDRYPTYQLTDFVEPASGLPLRIPKFYANLIDWQNQNDPLRQMVLPTAAESSAKPYELADPIGDKAHEPVPGLIHRYPDRGLLLLTTYCAVHCRFCFRREVVGHIRPVQLARIKTYIASQPQLTELIFSGGDPGTYPAEFLRSLQQQFAPLTQLKIWRFHTRVPAVDPLSLTEDWIDAIATAPVAQKVVVTHINHVREVTPEFRQLVRKLQQRGILTLSQTVLLKGINSTSADLEGLFRALAETGVKPYYLHHLDKAFGTDYWRLSIADGQQLYSSLRGRLSGWMIPEYVVELEGGMGKFPVMRLKELSPGKYEARTYDGQQATYVDPTVAATDS